MHAMMPSELSFSISSAICSQQIAWLIVVFSITYNQTNLEYSPDKQWKGTLLECSSDLRDILPLVICTDVANNSAERE